jgi:hypothetical protein
MSVRDQNIESLKVVAKGLVEFADQLAFVGGATIALYVDDPSAGDTRVTKDVDGVIEVAGYAGFAALEARLRKLGFQHAVELDAPICRWRYEGIVVDIMPTDPKILGFSNRWYPEAMRHRRKVEIAPGQWIFVFPLVFVLATKLDAFATRGRGDWMASRDLEDVIAILDGAQSAAEDLAATTGELRAYLQAELRKVIDHPSVDEIIQAHITPDPMGHERAQRVKALVAAFVKK